MSIMPINESIKEIHDYIRTCRASARAEVQITEHTNNSTNRKGVNKNNKSTGVRNVCWVERENLYVVQMMKKGERFRQSFPANQFKEACEFAKNKRRELFGTYAGNG